MTRVNSLVLDGSEIKVRLEAERVRSGSVVHVDWLRFTVATRFSPDVNIDAVFPPPLNKYDWYSRNLHRNLELIKLLPDSAQLVAHQAFDLGAEVANALGSDFSVRSEILKGHDFYKHRLAIVRNDAECGWVGFGASSDGPRQKAQARTIHVNLFGAACTFAAPGWRDRMAALIDKNHGDVTRCDLALDFFDGLPGGLDSIVDDYKSGRCDVGGRRLKCNTVGDWLNGRSRSLYFGSKEAGKQTNCYEKGDQLFGEPANSPWIRIELRYGNKLRELPSDMLRRPSDFFAGASDWHAEKLASVDCVASPAFVPCNGRLALETINAECARVVRWASNTAAPTMAALFSHLGDEFLEFVGGKKLPGRLQKFSHAEIHNGMQTAFNRFFAAEGRPALALAA